MVTISNVRIWALPYQGIEIETMIFQCFRILLIPKKETLAAIREGNNTKSRRHGMMDSMSSFLLSKCEVPKIIVLALFSEF